MEVSGQLHAPAPLRQYLLQFVLQYDVIILSMNLYWRSFMVFSLLVKWTFQVKQLKILSTDKDTEFETMHWYPAYITNVYLEKLIVM